MVVPGGQADPEPAIHLPANSFLGGTSMIVARRLAEVVLSFHSALAGPHAGVLSFVLPHRSYGLPGWSGVGRHEHCSTWRRKGRRSLCGQQLPERRV